MLKRKIINYFEEWSGKQHRKALLIKGARQVGKTTAVRQFAQTHYRNFIEINFEQNRKARQAFEGDLDANTIIMNLSSMGFGPFEKGSTLIFFDEIQSCPQARTAIKFLVEDGRFDYIESGSLLGINYKDVSSYPVGYEHQVEMFPLDFEEFLWACNVSGSVVEELKKCHDAQKPVSDFLHQQILRFLGQYFIIGGMPEVVNVFTQNSDIMQTVDVQTDILNSYRDDFSKYAGKDKILVKSVFDAIPKQLSKENKRFVIADLEKGAAQRKYASPTEWLSDAGIGYFSRNVSTLELPFAAFEKKNLYKLYMIDNGLLCSMMLGKQGLQAEILQGRLDINQGALAENFVAAELSKRGIPLHYYDRKSRHELDFVYPHGNKINIIEVKSGKDYRRHTSLDTAMETFGASVNEGIVLCKGNVEQKNGVRYLPLYMTMFL